MRKVLPLQYDRLGKSTVLADDTKNGGTEQLDRQLFDPRDAFDTVTRELCACPAEELVDAASLVQAVLDNDVLVAETSWMVQDGSYEVQLTYPIRTVNCNEVSATACMGASVLSLLFSHCRCRVPARLHLPARHWPCALFSGAQ